METDINTETKKHPGGRPLIINSVEEMETAIDKYFESLKRPLRDNKGNYIQDNDGNYIWEDTAPYTMAGLALALGMSRRALINYEGRPEFVPAITRARAMVEAYAEGRLYDKDGARGAQFALSNNHEGWTDKQEITTVNSGIPADDAIKLIAGLAGLLQAVQPRNVTPDQVAIEAKTEQI